MITRRMAVRAAAEAGVVAEGVGADLAVAVGQSVMMSKVELNLNKRKA